MILLLELGVAIALLMASAFFSASETALVSLSTTKAKRLALKNPAISQALLSWLDKPQELLIVILIGNTLTVVVFAAVMTTAAFNLFKAFPASYVGFAAWIVQTICLVIVAEMAPKFFARVNAEKTSIAVLPWLSRLRTLFRPLLSFLNWLIQKVTPRTTSRSAKAKLSFSLDELKAMLSEGLTPSKTQQESIQMMHGALKIQDAPVESIMTPIDRVDMVDLNPPGRAPSNHDVLIDLIIEQGHTRTPIQWKGSFLGFIHTDDLLPLMGSATPIDLTNMIRPAVDVKPDQKAHELLQIFRSSGTKIAFVKNDEQKVIGIVTLEDVLEEITGEILDEYDLSDLPKEGTP